MRSSPKIVRLAAARLAVVGLFGTAAVGVVGAVSPCAAAAAPAGDTGTLTVAIVVDFGNLPGAPPAPSTTCVTVPRDADGNDVLVARARALGTQAPRYLGSGLLCSIDGLPATGCGEQTEGGFRYWSYWTGTEGGWGYADAGPGFRSVTAAVTEGWRFTDGGPEGEDPPPAAPSAPAAVCRLAEASGAPSTGAPRNDGGADSAWPTLVGLAVVAGLAATSIHLNRRRRRSTLGGAP
jgi:hypothetical protein